MLTRQGPDHFKDQPQLQMIMGCSKGTVYVFDPWLVHQGRIDKYTKAKPPCEKRRRITHVKWFEPYSETENVNKFLVVYDDGTIYVYYTNARSESKDTVRLTINGTPKDVSKDKIVSYMQKAVENFDFDKYYTTAEREHSTQVKVLH